MQAGREEVVSQGPRRGERTSAAFERALWYEPLQPAVSASRAHRRRGHWVNVFLYRGMLALPPTLPPHALASLFARRISSTALLLVPSSMAQRVRMRSRCWGFHDANKPSGFEQTVHGLLALRLELHL